MGIPKFYRWISERYPCLSEVVKEHQVRKSFKMKMIDSMKRCVVCIIMHVQCTDHDIDACWPVPVQQCSVPALVVMCLCSV
jgi:5'-3' exonuclease